MTAKEYVLQPEQIEKAILNQMKEIKYWKIMAENLSSHGVEEHFDPNRPEEAPFVHCYEMIDEITHDIEENAEKLLILRKDVNYHISLLASFEEQQVLRYRYLEKKSWRQIERLMNLSKASVFRIHRKALTKLPVPAES